MGLPDSLLQGGPDRDDYQDVVKRYDQGPPYEGISDDEAMGRYQQVAPELAPDVYQQSAHDAFTRMAPEESAQFDSGGGSGLDRPFLEPAAKLSLDQRS